MGPLCDKGKHAGSLMTAFIITLTLLVLRCWVGEEGGHSSNVSSEQARPSVLSTIASPASPSPEIVVPEISWLLLCVLRRRDALYSFFLLIYPHSATYNLALHVVLTPSLLYTLYSTLTFKMDSLSAHNSSPAHRCWQHYRA